MAAPELPEYPAADQYDSDEPRPKLKRMMNVEETPLSWKEAMGDPVERKFINVGELLRFPKYRAPKGRREDVEDASKRLRYQLGTALDGFKKSFLEGKDHITFMLMPWRLLREEIYNHAKALDLAFLHLATNNCEINDMRILTSEGIIRKWVTELVDNRVMEHLSAKIQAARVMLKKADKRLAAAMEREKIVDRKLKLVDERLDEVTAIRDEIITHQRAA